MTFEQWNDADRWANFQRDQVSAISDTPFGHQMTELTMVVGAVAEQYAAWQKAIQYSSAAGSVDELLGQLCKLIFTGMVALCTVAPDADIVFAEHHTKIMAYNANVMARAVEGSNR